MDSDKEQDKEKEQEQEQVQEQEQDKEKTWRISFDVYQSEELSAYDGLINTPGWIAERKTYHPGLDILMTLKKAHNDFWSTPAGWKNKKQSRSKSIDWTATYNNALSMRSNQVWLPRDQQQPSLEDRCRAAGIPV